ncbi:MAG: alpha/beta hydrolase, partial [Gammaproteobacteria bacterium]|nr:alpha/beta hydrolase [Gammaproteobacteria bacterium]
MKMTAEESYDIRSVSRNLTYTPQNWPADLKADLYIPSKDGLLPVVITIHGGSWSGRSRTDMTSVAEKLAERGYAVFNISYRFAPAYTYPAQLHDVQQALRWIDNNADRYNFDRKRISTWGYSSGAHLAALVAGFESSEFQLPAIRS